MKLSGVRPSVRPSVFPLRHLPAARRCGGLLLSAVPAGDIDRQRGRVRKNTVSLLNTKPELFHSSKRKTKNDTPKLLRTHLG